MAYDTPIPGYRNHTVNTLRLWAATATQEFDLVDFIRGDYIAAVQSKMESETISKVLYPPDDTGSGKELRLKQQFFFVSATLQDIIRRYKRERKSFADFPDKVQIQLNDTHPAVAVPELMRLLMDEEDLGWEAAWDIVTRTFAYTNHTVLPEALEAWSQELFASLLPRHMALVREIDRRFRRAVSEQFPDEPERVERMAILSNGLARMANLAIVASHTVNGVAELHTKILRERIFRDFDEMYPERLIAITNGVTQRRWMLKANPPLSKLINSAIGDDWVTDLERLSELEPFADDAEFQRQWMVVKANNKAAVARMVSHEAGVRIGSDAIYDVQIKRIHEYKRQLLNALRVADLYLSLRDDPEMDIIPRAVMFGGKAAPTYYTAKQIIHLITALADAVNAEPRVREKLQVAFIPDYRVTLATRIIPGTDLSEQISTAGYEASGTGNMKFALNGALTIGTLDGANVEIAERVGAENMFIFGLDAGEVVARKRVGYDPRAVAEANPRLMRVLKLLSSGELTPAEPNAFQLLVDDLLNRDVYLLLADFDAYLAAQADVDAQYRDPDAWTRKAILNCARCGYFSSDRAVAEYASRVWKL
jgi:starch phosphorylase